jgi:hypothetical protein
MRTLQTVFIGAAAAAALLAGQPRAEAHHAFAAEFDARQPITLRGTVTRVEWINPHTWIHIDVKDTDGNVVEWMIEGGTPNTLLRAGVDRKSLPAGTEIVVDGYRAKSGLNRANGRDITLADGRKLSLGSSLKGSAGGDTPTDKK